MPDIRRTAFIAVTSIVLFGTAYSVLYKTYLDTSNPLLTHLPHPLHKTHYFANKANPLNTIFIKNAWGWTTAAFVALWLTSPPEARTIGRLSKWLAETAVWMVFTSWFFGPAVLERVIAASGGECVLTLPSGDVLSVPNEYCYTKSTLSPATHPSLFTSPSELLSLNGEWKSIPRLRRGHDISGHVFLLTMSVLFLADQLKASLSSKSWSVPHKFAVFANFALLGVWLFASYTTSVYFHTALEKVTGLLLGLVGYSMTLLPDFLGISTSTGSNSLRGREHARRE